MKKLLFALLLIPAMSFAQQQAQQERYFKITISETQLNYIYSLLNDEQTKLRLGTMQTLQTQVISQLNPPKIDSIAVTKAAHEKDSIAEAEHKKELKLKH